MGIHARIEKAYISIDTPAWLQQRTAGPLPELTADLRRWAARYEPCGPGERLWSLTTLGWCATRGHASPDPSDPLAGPLLIVHAATRLEHEVWIARALTPDGFPIAVVQLNDEIPVVYCDAASDPGDWFDADTVDIACPAGHGWTWRTGRELLTADGSFTTVSVVFGPNLDAPFTRCRNCTAYDTGRRTTPCGCDRTAWIICPTCGERCDVQLPEH